MVLLNSKKERELAYLTTVSGIEPMNADRLEAVDINGWRCVCGKGEFHPGDIAIYIEIDAQCPIDKKPWSDMTFLVSKKGKIKSQKIRGVISQGLLVPISAFGWNVVSDGTVIEQNGTIHKLNDDSRFLTKELNIIYAVQEDNIRKGKSPDKYKKMAQRHPELGDKWWWKYLYKKTWGKKLLFLFFGKKKDTRNWPAWLAKTDEERVQSAPWILNDTGIWIATEKIDGSSTSFTMRREKKLFHTHYDYYVCSRNVNFDTPEKSERCYYDSNIYLEMSEKYHVEGVLRSLLDEHPEWEWVTIQGETYGEGVQKRDYSIKEHDFRAFNFVTSKDHRWNSEKAAKLLKGYGIPWVPILGEITLDQFHNSVDEILNYATGISQLDGKPREGIVFRDMEGKKSFKAVSNEYLLKYHG